MYFNSKSFEIERWHTSEYVDSWMTNREREKGRSKLREKLVSLLPFDTKASIRVLDIGAGGGALSQEILSFFPNSKIVCQDFSDVMLDHAKKKLDQYSGLVDFVRSDLSNSDWAKNISGEFDAVVSSLVMHTVPGRVREIYREVYGLIKTGGCFLSADTSAPSGSIMENLFLRAHFKARQAAIKAETGIERSLEEIEKEIKEQRRIREKDFPRRARNPLRSTLTLMNHLGWLKEAGFTEVDCLWKNLQQAIVCGFKE